MKRISILDTTLRDGEQTNGVSFSSEEKQHLAREMILSAKISRVEIASCKTGEMEKKTVSQIMEWAKTTENEEKIEVLSFVDGKESFDWAEGAGCFNVNLLLKGSLSHCSGQLKKTLKEHKGDIAKTVQEGRRRGFKISAYLEDWSRGIQENNGYVDDMLSFLSGLHIKRIYLCDTLGVLSPWQVEEFVKSACQEYPDVDFEYHGHNDYGLATANALSAVRAGAKGIHVTINGLGERAGNCSLAEICVALSDFGIGKTDINESALPELSRLAEIYSRKILPENAPILGKNVFTHVSGIHADGQEKGKLYESKLTPERFGKRWSYGLGKLSGLKSLGQHLKSLDSIDLSLEEQKKLLEKIRFMGERKEELTSDILKTILQEVKK